MNRKEFFKKLGLGALVVAVAPKVLEPKAKSHLFTCSRSTGRVLTYKDAQLIADEDLKMGMWLPYGMIVPKTRRSGKTGIEWAMRTFEMSPMKKEKERVIKDLILYGKAKTKLL